MWFRRPRVSSDKIDHPGNLSQDELIKLVRDMKHDWGRLNSILNNRAKSNRWCNTYEANQRLYNQQFRVLQLKGRNGRDASGYGDEVARRWKDEYESRI